MKKTTEIAKTFKKDILFAAAIMIIVGILFVVYPDTSANMIAYVLGTALCVWGVVVMIAYFMSDRFYAFSSYGLVQGIALLAVGIVILANPAALTNIITGVFGVAMIVDGALKLQYAVDLARVRSERWWVVLIVALVIIIIGAVIVIDPIDVRRAATIFAGVWMILDGISDIVCVVYISKEFKRVRGLLIDVNTASDKLSDKND